MVPQTVPNGPKRPFEGSLKNCRAPIINRRHQKNQQIVWVGFLFWNHKSGIILWQANCQHWQLTIFQNWIYILDKILNTDIFLVEVAREHGNGPFKTLHLLDLTSTTDLKWWFVESFIVVSILWGDIFDTTTYYGLYLCYAPLARNIKHEMETTNYNILIQHLYKQGVLT